MSRLLILPLAFACIVGTASASSRPDKLAHESAQPASFDIAGVSVSQAVHLLYAEALKRDYVIAPEVLSDQRLVSFRYQAGSGDLEAFAKRFLESLGLAAERIGGADFVGPARKTESSKAEPEQFVYAPKYRNAGYLSRLLSPVFEGRFTLNRAVAAPTLSSTVTKDVPSTSAAGAIDQDAPVLIFVGSPKEIDTLKHLLTQVDTPPGEVIVKAAVYEVSTGKSDGNAVQLALSVLGGRISASIGSDSTPLPQALSIKLGGFTGVLSALASDSRFNVVTAPSLRVVSGATGNLTVGQSVPILGSVSYQGPNGTPVQNVIYKDSGTILNITPTVRGESIDVTIDQQISNFANTTTGLSTTPTLTKRQMQTSISTMDGDVVLLGGLTQTQDNHVTSSLPSLLRFMSSDRDDRSSSDVLIVLQVSRLAR